ncbi:MAG TPA: hypothetical protein VKS21_07675, partial [Spirochaetota bacterium]|nr:hypothetical protein [Spirochaetota bacterium]
IYSSTPPVNLFDTAALAYTVSDPHSGTALEQVLMISAAGLTNTNAELHSLDPGDYDNGTYTLLIRGRNHAGLVSNISFTVTVTNLGFTPLIGPNPLAAAQQDELRLYITGLTRDTEVEIVSVNGFRVAKFTDIISLSQEQANAETGTIYWDLTDEKGRPVAPGLYLVFITEHKLGQKKLYKFSFVR